MIRIVKKNCIGLLMFLLFSCNREKDLKFVYKEFYEGKEKVVGRFLNDTIRDGVFVHYYQNGDVARIRFYENGQIKGGVTDYYPNHKLAGYGIFLDNGETYQVNWFQNGDTMIVTEGRRSRGYHENGKPEMYSCLENKNYKIIAFDDNGKIKQFTGPLSYLTKRDSADLDKAYPDWKEQVREWKEKKQ